MRLSPESPIGDLECGSHAAAFLFWFEPSIKSRQLVPIFDSTFNLHFFHFLSFTGVINPVMRACGYLPYED